MAFDGYVKLEGIEGESTDAKHDKQIEILSYSFHVAQSGGASTSRHTGQTGARVDVGDFTFVKVLDKSSPNLFKYCASGKHIPTVVVELCSATENKHTYMKYTMSDVVVSSVRPGGATNADGSRPLEEVALRFGKLELEYTPFGNDGKAGGAVKASWDAEKNVAK